MKARQKEIKVLRREAKVILFKLEMGKEKKSRRIAVKNNKSF